MLGGDTRGALTTGQQQTGRKDDGTSRSFKDPSASPTPESHFEVIAETSPYAVANLRSGRNARE